MGERATSRLLTHRELAELLGIPVGTLYNWNSQGIGPKRYHVGRHVRYRMADVDKWLKARAVEGERAG